MAENTPPAPSALTVARCRHGTVMFPSNDVYVGRSLALYGEYSEAEVRLYSQIVRPGDVVVEAGANIGSLTLPLARLAGPEGKVYAFEPQRLVFQVLCANLALNAIENVHAVHAAIGALPGTINVPVVPYRSSVNFGGIGVGGEGGEPVEVKTVDAMGLDRLSLLKVDVEGAELAVLQGAVETIRRLRPALFIENDRRPNSAALITILWNMGYRLWWHLGPLFNAKNFRGNADNVFGKIVSANMLCLPAESTRKVEGLREIESPDDWWR